MPTEDDAAGLRRRTREFLSANDPAGMGRLEFLDARFDAGLAWVHFPPDLGGLGMDRALQVVVDAELEAAGAPDNDPGRGGIGLGMAAPTILAFGSPEQQQRFLRPLWTGREIWCQLFSEPGAGSDLANVATRAVRDGDGWRVSGQKVWTSLAHEADWAILLARTDPDLPKHRGLTYFLLDMRQPGVEVRPLRQLTGEAEFNEVFLDEAWVADDCRVSGVGDGWAVANGTLMNERVAIAAEPVDRGGGLIGKVVDSWRGLEEKDPALEDRLLAFWVEAEVVRLGGIRLAQKLAAGRPGPEDTASKVSFAALTQRLSAFELELLGADGLRYGDWELVRPSVVDWIGRDAGYRYLRARGNSIEGGSSEIVRNVVAERVLGLPKEARVDVDRPWRELAR